MKASGCSGAGEAARHLRACSAFSAEKSRRGTTRAMAAAVGIILMCSATLAAADDVSTPGSAAAGAGSTDQAATSAPALPSFSPTLKANPNPAKIELGAFGPIYLNGVVSGLGLTQDHPVPGDRRDRLDFSNAQMFVQKQDGVVQFFVQGGVYKITSLGARDFNALDYTRQLFGPVPVAFLKLAPTDAFSIQAGKLPTLIGAENPFTFQNLNIQRGLLFNQTNSINRGVQANYTVGSVSVSASLNDGFYSDRYNWFTGAVTWKIDDANTLVFDAGANLGRTTYQSFATPLLQNNSSIYNLIYTYSSGPWTVTPYVQFTNVQRDRTLGITESASTYGGAVLASYAFTPEFALAGRAEYIAQSGNRQTGATSLLYGPGSSAVSFAITPTFQRGVFFARGEYAYVKAFDTTPGLVFGRSGNATSQNRFVLETGVIF